MNIHEEAIVWLRIQQQHHLVFQRYYEDGRSKKHAEYHRTKVDLIGRIIDLVNIDEEERGDL